MAALKGSSHLTLIIITLLALGAGFIVGNLTPTLVTKNSNTAPQAEKDNNLFSSQTATFNGKILKVSGDMLSVKNEKGIDGEIKVFERTIITSPATAKNKQQTSYSDLNTLEINKDVLITLQLIGGQYQAVAINYLPSQSLIPSLPPIPKLPSP